MPRTRTRTVTARVADAEFTLIEGASGAQTVSAWARDQLLAAAGTRRPSTEEVLLGEIAALRTIVVNVQFALATGEPLSADGMQRLINRADLEKQQTAQARLAALTLPRRS